MDGDNNTLQNIWVGISQTYGITLNEAADRLRKAFSALNTAAREFADRLREMFDIVEETETNKQSIVTPKQYGISLLGGRKKKERCTTYGYISIAQRNLPYHRRIY